MVNYARVGLSQGKPWWKFVAILTSKSFVKPRHRGERLIEPFSSWFPPKFPSGLLKLFPLKISKGKWCSFFIEKLRFFSFHASTVASGKAND